MNVCRNEEVGERERKFGRVSDWTLEGMDHKIYNMLHVCKNEVYLTLKSGMYMYVFFSISHFPSYVVQGTRNLLWTGTERGIENRKKVEECNILEKVEFEERREIVEEEKIGSWGRRFVWKGICVEEKGKTLPQLGIICMTGIFPIEEERRWRRWRIQFLQGEHGMNRSGMMWRVERTTKWGFKKCVQLWLTLSSPIGFPWASKQDSKKRTNTELFSLQPPFYPHFSIIRSIIITLSSSSPVAHYMHFYFIRLSSTLSLDRFFLSFRSRTWFKCYLELNWITCKRWELCSWLTSRECGWRE